MDGTWMAEPAFQGVCTTDFCGVVVGQNMSGWVLMTVGMLIRQGILRTIIARKLAELAKARRTRSAPLEAKAQKSFEGGKPS